MRVGHTFLWDTFKVKPRHAIHSRVEGHSSLTPELYSRMGFETLIIGRISSDMSEWMKNNSALEFKWKGSYEGINGSYEYNSGIFTHVMHSGH